MAYDEYGRCSNGHESRCGNQGAHRKPGEAADAVPAGAARAKGRSNSDDESRNDGCRHSRWKTQAAPVFQADQGHQERSQRNTNDKRDPPLRIGWIPGGQGIEDDTANASDASYGEHHQDRREADENSANEALNRRKLCHGVFPALNRSIGQKTGEG